MGQRHGYLLLMGSARKLASWHRRHRPSLALDWVLLMRALQSWQDVL